MKSLLVTGGAGFIGSNFIRHFVTKFQKCNIINFDLLTYAGNLSNLADISTNPKYTFIKGDICDRQLIREIFKKYDIDTVVNFAAETHVDRSIEDPEIFLRTNVIGTQTLLDTALYFWKKNTLDKYCREFKKGVKFLQISTDEVYGTLGPEGLFTEESPLAANSPYSASKAAADLLVRAYHETYGIPVNITRCSNNYGPCQFPEKLIPLMINNSLNNKPLPVYGDGMQIRDWLHVQDHCSAICAVLQNGRQGEIYNIGGNNEKANIEIVKLIIDLLGKDDKLISYVNDRPGHDRRYAIDNTKITMQLGWQPQYTFEDGLTETISWYIDNVSWLEDIKHRDKNL